MMGPQKSSHLDLCIGHHVISEGQAVNLNTKLELKGAFIYIFFHLPNALLIYRWVNRPREIQRLLKITVHLGVKPMATQTLDTPHHDCCCHVVSWELVESTLSKPHLSSMAGCVTPREKGNCRGAICSLQMKRSWGKQPDGDFRKYPKKVLESFGGKSTYNHVSGILKCSAKSLPAVRLSAPSGDW